MRYLCYLLDGIDLEQMCSPHIASGFASRVTNCPRRSPPSPQFDVYLLELGARG